MPPPPTPPYLSGSSVLFPQFHAEFGRTAELQNFVDNQICKAAAGRCNTISRCSKFCNSNINQVSNIRVYANAGQEAILIFDWKIQSKLLFKQIYPFQSPSCDFL